MAETIEIKTKNAFQSHSYFWVMFQNLKSRPLEVSKKVDTFLEELVTVSDRSLGLLIFLLALALISC